MISNKGWRYYLGIAFFVYSFLPYCFAGFLMLLNIPTEKFLTISGVLIISAEISFVLSTLLLGKTVIQAIKSKMSTWFHKPEDSAAKDSIDDHTNAPKE
jgi:hypothetical protein